MNNFSWKVNYRLKRMEKVNILDFLSSLRSKIGDFKWLGNREVLIDGNHYVKSFDEAIKGTITFKYFREWLEESIVADVLKSTASVVMVDIRLFPFFNRHGDPKEILLIFVENVKLSIIKFLHQVTETPIISYTDHSEFKNCSIGPGVWIEKGAQIGRNTILVGNIYVYKDVVIGDNVIIKPGAVIGGQGFGFERDENGTPIHFPHIGSVVIEDNVMIGSCTCVDKGTLGKTILRSGCVLDNFVHVGHNVEIEKNTIITANVVIGGHVKIEEGAFVGISTSILPGRVIGKKSLTGMASCVIKNVDEDSIVMGVPAKPKK